MGRMKTTSAQDDSRNSLTIHRWTCAFAFALGLMMIMPRPATAAFGWQVVPVSSTNHLFSAITRVNSNTLWIASMRPSIVKSTNGGVTWTENVLPGVNPLLGITAAGERVGWAVGPGGIYHTTNA